jgi:hypothetical protein
MLSPMKSKTSRAAPPATLNFVTSLQTPPPPVPKDCVGLCVTDRAAREEILHRAYSIWENTGRPENHELANWLEAEAQVLGTN